MIHNINELKMRANQCMQEKKYSMAIEYLQKLIQINPEDTEAVYMAAAAAVQLENGEKIQPVKMQQEWKRLANEYLQCKNYLQVIAVTEKLIKLDKSNYEALYMQAAAYLYLDENEKAFELAKKVVEINPHYIGAYMAMAFYYDKKLLLQENIAVLEKVIRLNENKSKITSGGSHVECDLVSQAWQQLAVSNLLLGNISVAQKAYLKASEMKQGFIGKVEEYSGYLMCTNYDLTFSDEAMFYEHSKFNQFFSNIKEYEHSNIQKKSKLRIGYISPDFRQHAVVFYCYAFLSYYDKEKFEIVCYYKGESDITTEQLKSFGVEWYDIQTLNTEETARKIYADKIDILVELAGHTAQNCLPVLAYKPAPIQVCGIGYFNTTGLKAIDYFFTDINVDPIGTNDVFFTEQLLRLPTTHWCYTKRLDVPDCEETPYMKNQYITFGSFNNFSKTTDDMLLLWKKILKQVPNSRIVFKSKVFGSEYGCSIIKTRLMRLGFDLVQIQFRPSTASHMQEYLDLDIALDTYPYVGGVTTCEALYMGVPVITLAGRRHGARFGYSMLKNLNLEECIAYDKNEYVKKAIVLANNIPRLNSLHKIKLRQMMIESPLMDGKQYMSDLEQVYQKIWDKLVKNRSVEKDVNKKTSLVEVLYSIYTADNIESNFLTVKNFIKEDIAKTVLTLKISKKEKIRFLNFMAIKFYEIHFFENAILLLSTALSLTKNENDITLKNLGIVLYNLGEKEAAMKYWLQIKEKDKQIISLLNL